MHFGLKAADLFEDVVGVCDIKKRTGEVTFTGQKMKFPLRISPFTGEVLVFLCRLRRLEEY